MMLLFKAWVRIRNIDVSFIYEAGSVLEAIKIAEDRAKALDAVLKTVDNLYLGSNHLKVKNPKM